MRQVRTATAKEHGVEQSQPHIVLVEDDQDIRELFTIVLEQAGYIVTAVEDGHTAQAVLHTGCGGLLITDYHLPDTYGSWLIGYAQTVAPHLVTMLISADPQVASLAAGCGARAWFLKGEPLGEFLATVATICTPGAAPAECASCV